MSKKILIVLGTRPEVIKLAPVILALKNSPLKNNFIVASTSQHEELLDEQLNYWQITPDYFLTSFPYKGNLTRLLGHTLSGLQDILEQIRTIEYIIVQGDTNTSLACSNLAILNQLKLIHIEAGLRSFDFNNPFPEEFNRFITSRVAHFHFAPTEISKSNLIREGINPSKIMVVGNTVIDALYYVKRINKNPVSENHEIVLITLHRRENIDKNYLLLIDIAGELASQHPGLKFIWVTHPNCAHNIRSKINASGNIEVHDHMPYNRFVHIYDCAKMVITDSGGVSEEAIHLGLPVIIYRQSTERVEAIVHKYPMIVSLKKNEIISFFNDNLDKPNSIKYSYGKGNASQKIISWLCSEINTVDYETVIIGGGPAGTGVLLKALKDGAGNKLFNKRIALIEKSSHLIKGNITQYKVNSDTFSDVFLECLEGATCELINTEGLKNEIDFITKYKGKSIPLEKLNDYYNKLGCLLKECLEASGKCDFFMDSPVNKLVRKENGIYEVVIAGGEKSITAKQIIMATGGIPQNINKENTVFADKISLYKYGKKSFHSDCILKSGIPGKLKTELRKKPKVVILGGSHSAFSVAHYLLNLSESFNFHSGDIKIWCKSIPKIYFNTKEDAIAIGYKDFTETDFCPITKKMYRLAGLRMDGRDLYMQMLGLGASEKEERVSLRLFTDQQSEIETDLNNATFIVLAYGYRLNIVPLFNETGEQIRLKGEYTNHWVNHNCEMLDVNGNIIPNVFASGLATGFIPTGDLGGEPGFMGQTNGIWYYQNAIADRIITKLEREHSANMS